MKTRGWHFHLTSLAPANLLLAVVGLGGLALYSRLMTTEQYGAYVLALTAQLLGQWLLFSWLTMSVARFTPRMRKPRQARELLTTVYAMALMVGLALMGLAWGLDMLYPEGSGRYRPLVFATMSMMVCRSMAQIGLESHRANLRIGRYSLLESSQALAGLGFGYVLVSRGAGQPEFALWGSALANLGLLVVDLPWILRNLRPGCFSRPLLQSIWQYGWPMAVSLVLCMSLASLDRFLLGYLTGEEAVALYGAAVSIAERPLSIAFNWIGSATISLSFNAYEREGISAANAIMQGALVTLILLTWPMAFGLAALAEPIATFMLGREFHQGVANLLPWVALIGLLKGFVDHYFAQTFQLTGRTAALSGTYAAALGVNLLANLILIPAFGLPGAIASAVLAYVTAMILQVALADAGLRRRPPMMDMLKALLACGLMYGVVRLLAFSGTVQGLLQGVGAGVLSYGLVAYWLDLAGIRRRIARGLADPKR